MSMIWFDDFEHCDRVAVPGTGEEPRRVYSIKTEDPYAGLNRQQRRKAIAVESRAERKKRKKRG